MPRLPTSSTPILHVVRRLPAVLQATKPWQSGQTAYLLRQLQRHRPVISKIDDQEHVVSAAKWLGNAQDATCDGGVAGRFLIGQGWTKAYPKTTGDLVPTFLSLARYLDDSRFFERARACVAFLLPLQLPCGAFCGGEVGTANESPSAFNTAQIVAGLTAWHKATGDQLSLDCAERAADWLCSIQDADGAWRQHFYNDVASAHNAYLACWIAELGLLLGNTTYLESARRNLKWVLSLQVPATGWIDLAGYDHQQQRQRVALTHSIAYTLMGALRIAQALGDHGALLMVAKAAEPPARHLLNFGFLPAIFDWQWHAQTSYSCLPGNAQMAELWLTLNAIAPEKCFFDAAKAALDVIKQCQSTSHANDAIRGGIPGSNPIWGDYIFLGLPNWGAKFFVDALLLMCQQTTIGPTYIRGTHG